jgi:hypothetical protein
MANLESPGAVPVAQPSPEDQRFELQGLLGEFHGLLTAIGDRLNQLSEDESFTLNEGMKTLLVDIRNAFPGVSVSFGQVQDELNTARHDADLGEVALTDR